MDTANDNPLKRFSSFWLGVILFGSFGILCLLALPWLGKEPQEGYMKERVAERRDIRKEVETEQAGAFKAAPDSAFAETGKALVAAKAAAVEEQMWILPGSPRAEALAAAPRAKVEVPETPADAPIDPAVMELGKTSFALCLACHGPTGEGIPNLGPPLAGSEWVLGPIENLIRIQLRGLQGPITVKGVDYKPVAPMPAQPFQTDEQIAAVLTFVRNSWGNKASLVTPEQVKAFRGEVGSPMLTAADLKKPEAAPAPAPEAK